MDFRQEFKSSFIRLPALGAGMSEYSLLGEVYGSTPDHGRRHDLCARAQLDHLPAAVFLPHPLARMLPASPYDQRKRYAALRKPDARVKREDPFVF